MPVIGDFHYNGHVLLIKYPECARALAKYRINPGNVGGKHHDDNFSAIVKVAIDNGKPVRIGVNWGSLDQNLLTEHDGRELQAARSRSSARDVTMNAMVESAIQSAELAEQTGLPPRPHHPVRQGLGRSGSGGRLSQARAALRLSAAPGSDRGGHGRQGHRGQRGRALHPAPGGHRRHHSRVADTEAGGDRTEEVQVAQQILQSLGLRSFIPQVTACPGCGRTTSTFFQEMAEQIQTYLREQMPVWKSKYSGVEELNVAVMGCVVNGPGESKHANIGISLPGTFEEPKAPVFVDGALKLTLKGDRIVAEFLEILDRLRREALRHGQEVARPA